MLLDMIISRKHVFQLSFIEIVDTTKVCSFTVYSITRTKGIIKQLEGITKSDDRGDLRIYTMSIMCLRFHKNVVRKNMVFALLFVCFEYKHGIDIAPSHLILPLQHDIYGEDVHFRHFMCLNL